MERLCVSLGGLVCGEIRDKFDAYPKENLLKSIDSARKNKLGILFKRSLGDIQITANGLDPFEADAKNVLQSNASILHMVVTASDILSARQIEHVFFKGPLQQKILYGDFFAKPSGDADVLVSGEFFNKASALLVESGFTLPPGYDTLWWRFFLGEQPLFKNGARSSGLDLHHRLQQPGSPSPYDTRAFVKNVQAVALGSRLVRAPTLPAIAFVAAMNLVKAIYNREPGGSHALDLQMALYLLSHGEMEQLRVDARRQGLDKTLRFSSRASSLVFEVDDLYNSSVYEFPYTVQTSRAMIMAPAENIAVMPRRRDMLGLLSDRWFPDRLRETCRWALSEGARVIGRQG